MDMNVYTQRRVFRVLMRYQLFHGLFMAKRRLG